MSVLCLRLGGQLQSWGDSSRFTRRETRSEPTKSGVLGLLAAAAGRRRTDPIEDLARLRFGVRVDQPGRLVRDFQTAIRWQDGGAKPAAMPLSYRYYLSDAVFVAAVEGEVELLTGLDEALTTPTFPLYLGRRSCPVSGRLRLGVHEGRLESVLRALEWQAAPWHRKQLATRVDLPVYLDADSGDSEVATETVRDVPVAFDPVRREYGWRQVTQAAPVVVENPLGQRHDLDFMAALGGA